MRRNLYRPFVLAMPSAHSKIHMSHVSFSDAPPGVQGAYISASTVEWPKDAPQAERTIETDSDRAGCRHTRRPTSGILVRTGVRPLLLDPLVDDVVAVKYQRQHQEASKAGIGA